MSNIDTTTDVPTTFIQLEGDNVPIKMWTKYVPVESEAINQLKDIAKLPFIFKHVAVMPDVHVGTGSTIGTVIATKGVTLPAATGVDLGCGMLAVKTSLKMEDFPSNLHQLRNEIEHMVPVGMDDHSSSLHKKGHQGTTKLLNNHFTQLESRLSEIIKKHPAIDKMVHNAAEKSYRQIGSLGGGNHFIELCIATDKSIWIMLHSGSRGIGNAIGRYFIDIAKKEMESNQIELPNKDLAYLKEGSQYYSDYLEAVHWAQDYAKRNREVMLELVITAMTRHLPPFKCDKEIIQSHHNYISEEVHFGENVIITRKGAVDAHTGKLGIIPSSMGGKSFIVEGLGNVDSFCSCQHGSGRTMSRTAAKKLITIEHHIRDTAGVECRKDIGVIDESPSAYKNIDDVMRSSEDLIKVKYELKQFLCVKG